jgi:Domain of Unknown Function (DUF1080)
MRKLVFLAWLALVLPATGAEINIVFGNYSDDQSLTNNLTNDFSSALAGGGRPGDWKIVTDEVPSAFAPLSSNAPAVNHIPVLAQLDTDPTDTRFPMLIYDKETFKDFTLTTRFKILDGMMEQMAGVVFGFQNSSNFDVVRVSALGHNLRFYKYANGQFFNPVNINLDISPDTWHTLTVQSKNDQIACWLDNTPVMPPARAETLTAGKIGFWTMADSLTHFGDTTISYTPIVPMAQIVVQNVMEQQPRILGLRIYALDKTGTPHVIASNMAAEVGQAGTDAEKSAITNDATFFGRGRGTVAVTMPLTDRNGDPVAAVRVQLKSFMGETRDTALTRARMIVNLIQTQILTGQDLTQ